MAKKQFQSGKINQNADATSTSKPEILTATGPQEQDTFGNSSPKHKPVK